MSGPQFEGRSAFVTGGGSGIGAAAAELLAQEGAAVAVVDLNGATAAKVAARIRAGGGSAIEVTADISTAKGNAAAFDAAEAAFGPIDLAFLNAGALQPYVPLDGLDLATFDQMININLRGAFLGVKQAHSRLRSGGACVVTASAAGLIGFPDGLAYSAAKHGVVGIVRSAARDFAARGLRINAICPGMVATPMIGFPACEGVVPVDRLETPEYRGAIAPQAVAEAALFLLSHGAAAINGQAQAVDAALLSAFAPISEG